MKMYLSHSNQSGAALVVGMILLIVLTLMALSTMNTASLDLVMTGNQQYHEQAFAAAETGIQQAIMTEPFNLNADSSASAATGINSKDNYQYAVTRPFGNSTQGAPGGYSMTSFNTAYFRITSTGTSARNSNAINLQELYIPVQADAGAPPGTPPSCSSSGDIYGSSTCN